MTRIDLAAASKGLIAAAAACAAILLPTAPASAEFTCTDDTTFPCGIQIDKLGIQKVPAVFKFQARVSQAKLPIGKGTFGEVVVKLLEGNTTVCKEEFQNVEVRDSVLNLEIGRNMSCELDEMIAFRSSLAFQICLGSEDSCLKPVELSTVPYAVKASFAQLAQSAHAADEAALAHYAHRVTADRQLGLTKSLAIGYFDFYTPQPSSGSQDTGGYIKWTPVAGQTGARKLTITAQDVDQTGDGDLPIPLDLLVLDSGSTQLNGALAVAGAATVGTTLTVTQDIDVMRDLEVFHDTALGGLLTVTGAATLSAGLTVAGDASVGQGLTVGGAATFQGSTTTAGTASFADLVTLDSDLVTHGTVALATPDDGAGTGKRYASLALSGGDSDADLLVLGPRAPAGYDELPEIHIDAPLKVNAPLTAAANVIFQAEAQHDGSVRFNDIVDFSNAKEIVGLKLGDDGGGVTLGNWSFQGEFMNHEGQSVLQGKAGTADLTALGPLTIAGTTVAKGGLSVLGFDNGKVAFFDVDADFRRNANFQGDITLQFDDGSTSQLFKTRADGAVHVDDNRALKELVIEAPTSWTANAAVAFGGPVMAAKAVDVQGELRANDRLRIGASWTFKDGEGLRNANRVGLSVSGNAITLDASKQFKNGTKTGGALLVGGKLTGAAGLVVNSGNAVQLSVDGTGTRIHKRAKVDGELDADPAGAGRLRVTADGVALDGTVNTVQGTLQINGAASVSNGLGGSGALKVKHGSCVNVSGQCPADHFAVGRYTYENCWLWGWNCNTVVTDDTRCCTMELTN